MRKIMFAAVVAVCLAGCRPAAKVVEGKVVDAAMNTIVLSVGDGEDVCVSTLFSDPARVEGVLIGDVVSIRCNEIARADGSAVLMAESLEVLSPSYYRLIAGIWEMSLPDGGTAGFTLAEDGTAEPRGTTDFHVSNYVLDGAELALTSGDGVEVFNIAKLDADSLVLRRTAGGEVEWACARR